MSTVDILVTFVLIVAALFFILRPGRPKFTIERVGPADRLDGVDWEPSDERWFRVRFSGRPSEATIVDEPGRSFLEAKDLRLKEAKDLRLKVARLERQLLRSRTRHKKASRLVRDLLHAAEAQSAQAKAQEPTRPISQQIGTLSIGSICYSISFGTEFEVLGTLDGMTVVRSTIRETLMSMRPGLLVYLSPRDGSVTPRKHNLGKAA